MSTKNSSCILRLRTVMERTGLTRSTLYRMIQLGAFPKQLRISRRCIGWREYELEEWLQDPAGYVRDNQAEI